MQLLVIDGPLTGEQRGALFAYLTDENDVVLVDEADVPLRSEAS